MGRINGEHGAVGQVPVHYLFQSMNRAELVALYLAADAMVITPLRDGMNLVAKEYVACTARKLVSWVDLRFCPLSAAREGAGSPV